MDVEHQEKERNNVGYIRHKAYLNTRSFSNGSLFMLNSRTFANVYKCTYRFVLCTHSRCQKANHDRENKNFGPSNSMLYGILPGTAMRIFFYQVSLKTNYANAFCVEAEQKLMVLSLLNSAINLAYLYS